MNYTILSPTNTCAIVCFEDYLTASGIVQIYLETLNSRQRTAPSSGAKDADWSHFTAGPMQPTEENSTELVAQGPEAHFKDQSMEGCWQPESREEMSLYINLFWTHKPASSSW